MNLLYFTLGFIALRLLDYLLVIYAEQEDVPSVESWIDDIERAIVS
jgi:hypothetical protein